MVFEQQVLFRVESLCDFQPLFLVPRGGARGKNLGHLKKKKFFFYSFLAHLSRRLIGELIVYP